MKKVTCKKCGAENPAGYLLCKNCGEELYGPRVEDEIKKGRLLYHEEKLDEAWECLRPIVEEHPENESAKEAMELVEEAIRSKGKKEQGREKIGYNPAIPWMSVGFILVIIGLFIIIATSMSPPQPPSGMQAEDWENYADEMQTYADYIKYGGIIELIGLVLFMSATIYGVSWNADNIRMMSPKK